MNIMVDYVEEEAWRRKGTKKKVWNDETKEWEDTVVWRIKGDRDVLTWLEENYPNKDGWGTVFSNNIIVMEEKVYVHYALCAKSW